MGSETRGIEVRGHVNMGCESGGIGGTTIVAEVDSVYGNTIGASTGYGIDMESLYWPNILWSSVISSSW